MVNTLLPQELFSAADDTGDAVVMPQRTLGALRRQLDGLSAKWDVKHAELVMSKEVQAGASALFASVMDQAKRIVARKRVPSVDNKQLEDANGGINSHEEHLHDKENEAIERQKRKVDVAWGSDKMNEEEKAGLDRRQPPAIASNSDQGPLVVGRCEKGTRVVAQKGDGG